MFGLFEKKAAATGPRNDAVTLTNKLTRSAIAVSAAVIFVFMVLLYVLIVAAQIIVFALTYNAHTMNSARFIAESMRETMSILEECPDPIIEGDALNTIQHIVQLSPNIYGSGVALTPEAARRWDGTNAYMLYAWEDSLTGRVLTAYVDEERPDYDYTQQEWFKVPMETGENYWSDPYVSHSMGDVLVCTCAHTLYDKKDRRVGVMFLDIPVNDGIRKMLNPIYRDEAQGKDYKMRLIGGDGRVIVGDSLKRDHDLLVLHEKIEGSRWTLECHLLDNYNVVWYFEKTFYAIAVLYLFIVIAIYFSVRFTMRRLSRSDVQRQMRRLTELDVAGKIQQGMLPKGDMRGVAAVMIPAKEVGGDLYNYFELDGRLYFIIGDVSGKGVAAALVMSIATHLFRSIAPGETDPAAIVEKINNQMAYDNSTSMFITMIVGILDKERGVMTLCNAGHNPPYCDGRFMQLPTNIAVGVCEHIEYRTHTMPFAAGSRIVLYTDGVTEAMNRKEQQYGAGRLLQTLQAVLGRRTASEQDVCDAIVNDVRRFAGTKHQTDDITLIVISGGRD